MNKAQLIEKLEAWLFNHCPPEFAGELRMTTVNAKETLEVIRELLEQLYEPKAKIPQFVASWLAECRLNATLSECMNGSFGFSDGRSQAKDEFFEWINSDDNETVLAIAWIYGYEVEKEPQWIVKVGEKYFHSWTLLSSCEPYTVRLKSNAYRITDKKKADALAIFIGGEVVPVEGEE